MCSTLIKTRVAGAIIAAAIASTVVGPGVAGAQDMRTPDARHLGEQASPSEDRRSPDARDIPAPPESQPISEAPAAPSGFDPVSAAIGAAAGTGLLIVLMAFLGTGGLAGRRRHRTLGA